MGGSFCREDAPAGLTRTNDTEVNNEITTVIERANKSQQILSPESSVANEQEKDVENIRESGSLVTSEWGSKDAPINNASLQTNESKSINDTEPANKTPSNKHYSHIFHLTLFSIYGITLRAYSARLFGQDCDSPSPPSDFLTPLSQNLCVTTSGETNQYGGALFIDLPSNMLGSAIMGFFTGHSKDHPTVPWLKHHHPAQTDDGLHLGLKTALCGTITTFSSWNAQMVLMMDGTGTVLGSQVVAALFGYVLGLLVAIKCFEGGRTLAAWCHLRVNPHVFEVDGPYCEDDDVNVKGDFEAKEQLKRWHHWNSRVVPSIFAVILFILYLLGHLYWEIAWYRQLWISCLLGPFGTFMRWRLSSLNGKLRHENWQWFPVGTFAANFVACIISCSINAIFTASIVEPYSWPHDILAGIKVGFAGCLSTVSTLVKEVVEIESKNPHFDKKAFIYSYGTLILCCFTGLLIYCPIVRFV